MISTGTPKPRHSVGRALDRLATRVFGVPPATSAYTVTRGVRIPVYDGVELAADLYQDPGTGVGLRPARHTIHHGQGGCSRLVLARRRA